MALEPITEPLLSTEDVENLVPPPIADIQKNEKQKKVTIESVFHHAKRFLMPPLAPLKESSPIAEKFRASKERLRVFGGWAQIVDIHPSVESSDVPLVYGPGFSETFTPELFQNFIEHLSTNMERRTLSIEHARFGHSIADRVKTTVLPVDELHQAAAKFVQERGGNVPLDEIRKAVALLTLLASKEIKQADVICHSEGAINVAIAAKLQPEKFRSITFVAPAGLIGKDSFIDLARRIPQDLMQMLLYAKDYPDKRNVIMRGLSAARAYWMQNPLMALKEVHAISKTEVKDLMHELHASGIKICVIASTDDKLFPIERLRAGLPGAAGEITDPKVRYLQEMDLDEFVELPGTHNELLTNPQLYIGKYKELLSRMLGKKAEKGSGQQKMTEQEIPQQPERIAA